MNFRDDIHKENFRRFVASIYEDIEGKELTDKVPLEDLVEVFIKHRGEYQRRLKGYKRSMSMSYAWKGKRFNFMQGIKQYSRNVSGKIKSTGLLSGWIKKGRLKVTKKNLRPSELKNLKKRGIKEYISAVVVSDLTNYDTYDFLRALNNLKTGILKEAQYFSLEEKFVNFSLFVEEVCKALSNIERGVLEESEIDLPDFETLLILLRDDLFTSEDYKNLPKDQSFVELFLSLYSTEKIDISEIMIENEELGLDSEVKNDIKNKQVITGSNGNETLVDIHMETNPKAVSILNMKIPEKSDKP